MFGRLLEISGAVRFRRFMAQATAPERAAAVTTIVLVVSGIAFRTLSLTTAPLGTDEATWAVHLMEEPLAELLIRPIGFMGIERTLAHVFGASEGVLRLLPWLAGIGVTVLSVPLGRRLLRSEASRLLFVSLIALDPAAIDLSKEFKPYSVCLFLHAWLAFLALRYADTRKTSALVWALGVSLVAVLFAQDAIFAYPGVFLLLGIEAIRERRFRHFAGIFVAGLLTVAVIGALYVFVWSKLNHDSEESYWGKKYNVFFVKGGTQTEWTLSRYADMVQSPAYRRDLWESKRLSERELEELGALHGAVFLVLNLLGAGVIVRGKKWREGLLLLMPLAVLTAFNVLGFWPYGPFRTNVFTTVYIAGIAGFAVDRQPMKTRWADLVPLVLIVLLPLFAFERDWHRTKRWWGRQSTFPEALDRLVALSPDAPRNGKPEALLADNFSCQLYRYYTRYEPAVSRRVSSVLGKRFKFVCAQELPRILRYARSSLEGPRDRVWFLISGPPVVDTLRKSWPRDLHRAISVHVGEGRRNSHYIYAVQTSKVENEPPP